ncbi:MAG: helix-turn-helix transcriptional regulator [Candidatus Planktophila sp.]|nr:helix-turn-helix transcriptional regulator [Candidatus Planktophila sp.]
MAKSFDEIMAPYRANRSLESKEANEVFSAVYTISGSIIAARKIRKLTQVQLARLSGVQQGDISRIENGNLLPTTATLSKLLLALGARMSIELVDEKLIPNKPTVESIQDARSSLTSKTKNPRELLKKVSAR